MCDFCEKQNGIETKAWDDEFDLTVWISSYDNPELLNIRLGRGFIGSTKPFKINFCPYCGKDLAELKRYLDNLY